jgi:hypothetical protein
VTDDIAARIRDLLDDVDLGPQLKGLIGGAGGAGGLDLGTLFEKIQANPDLLARVQAALGNVDLGSAVAGLTGGGTALPDLGGVDLGGLGDTLGGMLGGDKKA